MPHTENPSEFAILKTSKSGASDVAVLPYRKCLITIATALSKRTVVEILAGDGGQLPES
jgi:hypothetical protein